MHERNIMDYFDGLSIPLAGSVPHHKSVVVNNPRYHSIQFNYSGSFFLQIGDGKVHTCSGPYAFLTWPGERFTYGTLDDKSRRHHCYVCASGPRVEQYIKRGLFIKNVSDPLVSVIYADAFLHKIREIIRLGEHAEQSNPRAVLLFEELLLDMYEERQSEKRCLAEHHYFLNTLVERIKDAPEKDHDFAHYADLCEVTLIHFRRIFKDHTGFSPHHFLLKMRLHKAADMLVKSSMPIKQVASLSGWDDEYYFSRLFKQYYHLSPLQYRKESSAAD